MKRNRQEEIIEDLTTECACCGTQYHKGDGRSYFESGHQQHVINICEVCWDDYRLETEVEETDSDELSTERYTALALWVTRTAVLSFTERQNIPNTPQDVAEFFDALTKLLVWHPDDSFFDYVNQETGARMFTDDEAVDLDTVMCRCRKIAKGNKTDVCEWGLRALQRAGRAPLDPLPAPPSSDLSL